MRYSIIFACLFFVTLGAMAQEKRDTIRSVNARPTVIGKTETAKTDPSTMSRMEKAKMLKAQQKDILEQLDLSREQQKKWKESNKLFRTRLQELKGNENISKREKGQKVKELMEEREAELKTFLTEEQMKKYRELTKHKAAAFESKD